MASLWAVSEWPRNHKSIDAIHLRENILIGK
jgi:hypothetical protein